MNEKLTEHQKTQRKKDFFRKIEELHSEFHIGYDLGQNVTENEDLVREHIQPNPQRYFQENKNAELDFYNSIFDKYVLHKHVFKKASENVIAALCGSDSSESVVAGFDEASLLEGLLPLMTSEEFKSDFSQAHPGSPIVNTLNKSFNEIISSLSKYIEKNPNEASIYLCRGLVFEKQGEYGRAIVDFEKVGTLETKTLYEQLFAEFKIENLKKNS